MRVVTKSAKKTNTTRQNGDSGGARNGRELSVHAATKPMPLSMGSHALTVQLLFDNLDEIAVVEFPVRVLRPDGTATPLLPAAVHHRIRSREPPTTSATSASTPTASTASSGRRLHTRCFVRLRGCIGCCDLGARPWGLAWNWHVEPVLLLLKGGAKKVERVLAVVASCELKLPCT